MFEQMETSKSIYEGLFVSSETSTEWSDANHSVINRKQILETALSTNNPKNGDSARKRKSINIDNPSGK